MDCAHAPQLLRARMLDGSDRKFWVRIYPALPTAKDFHENHAFGFPWWEPDEDDFEGPGFLEPEEIWQPSRYAAPPGQHHRGLFDWFKNGLPVDQLATRPVPDVCAGLAIDETGGMVFDGGGFPQLVRSDVINQAVVVTATSAPQDIVSLVSNQARVVTATSAFQDIASDVDNASFVSTTTTPATSRSSAVIDRQIVVTATSAFQHIHSDVADEQVVTTKVMPATVITSDVVDAQVVTSEIVPAKPVASLVVDEQTVSSVVHVGQSRTSHVIDRQIVQTATSGPQNIRSDVIDAQVVTSLVIPAADVGSAVVNQQTVTTQVVKATPIKSLVQDQETVTTTVTSPPFLTRAILTFTQGSTTSITIPGVTVNAGEMLFLSFSLSAPRSIAAAFWGTQAASVAGSDPNARCVIFVWQLPGSGTHDITMSWSGGNADIVAIVRAWSGSPSPIHLDLAVQNSATSSTALTVSTGSATAHAVELVYYAGGITSPGSDPAPVWNAPLTTGLYENLATCGISEAWYFTTATGVQTGSTTLANPHNWGAVVMTWFQ